MSNDRKHFEEYRAQTQAKHTILENYLYAYFNVVKTLGGDNLVYIDGFAGRGTYTDDHGNEVPGSPIRALEKIASHADLSKKVSSIFIEKDKVLYDQLVGHLRAFHQKNPQIREPQWGNADFSGAMTELLDHYDKEKRRLAPAFVFVDPCGVDGVDFNVIDRVLRNQAKAEVFLFFNIEGIKRILGLDEAMGPTLSRVVGGDERKAALLKVVRSCNSADERERAIITFYEDLLRQQTPAGYVVSFRVEREQRKVTSHYLIHASQHAMGFRIMKEVMWKVGKTDGGRGGLTLEQASVTGMEMLFSPDMSEIGQSILNELRSGPKLAKHFYATLPEMADNRLCAPAYRPALLELEKNGTIVVLENDCRTPAPKRQMRKGVMTLGENYWINLP